MTGPSNISKILTIGDSHSNSPFPKNAMYKNQSIVKFSGNQSTDGPENEKVDPLDQVIES